MKKKKENRSPNFFQISMLNFGKNVYRKKYCLINHNRALDFYGGQLNRNRTRASDRIPKNPAQIRSSFELYLWN